jgi:hypothetical protein
MKATLHFTSVFVLNTALFFLGLFSVTQSGLINGTVQDRTGAALQNVEILNLSTNFVAMSDEKGNFEINAKQKDTLRFLGLGFPVFDTIVGPTTNLVITLGRIQKPAPMPAYKSTSHTYDERTKTATTKTVRGHVSDAAGALPGANVVVRGTTFGVSTDYDGFFTIEVSEGEQLVVSFVGLSDKTITVDKADTINVKLDDSGVTLSEVVIDGYKSHSKKKSMASSVVIRGASGVTDAAPADKPIGKIGGKTPGLHISTTSESAQNVKAGQLTSGEINDFSKWTYWEDVATAQLDAFQKTWKMAPALRFSVILSHADGFAVQNQTVHLMTESGDTIWTSRTGNTGRAELWFKPEITERQKITKNLVLIDNTGKIIADNPKEFRNGINTFTYAGSCFTPEKVDIAFMVDATGSMGDEINYLQSELSDVIERTKKALPDADLRIGSVFYRDTGDDYVVKNFDFTRKIRDVLAFVGKQSAGGGGDYPEAVVEAFDAAIDQLHWDEDARARLLFVVLDAPAHENEATIKKLQALAHRASAKGIKIIPVAASGIDKSTEYLMRVMALQTNGTYLFITNHSGIGNDHIEPTADSYTVEMLNDLLLRVILQFTATGDCTSQVLPTNAKMDAALEKKQKVQWQYYPNPTSGKVTVDCGKKATGLSLFDTTGKLVLRQNTSSDNYVIDLTGLPNAVYYLNVTVGDEILTGKIIKRM